MIVEKYITSRLKKYAYDIIKNISNRNTTGQAKAITQDWVLVPNPQHIENGQVLVRPLV